jgi:hypothetical protein
MKLTARLSRRLAAGIGIASAAVLLPTAALASSAAAGASSHLEVKGCTSVNTKVWYGLPFEGAAGHFFYQLQFSNIGRSTCSFFGYPGVSALDVHGHQVGLPATHSGPRATVTLAPGATAHVLLEVTDAGAVCAHPVKAVTLRVFPPNQVHAQLVPFRSLGCPGKSVMHVDAMHPRAGIPGFSTS